jgi:ATP-binding cassette subfamily B protein
MYNERVKHMNSMPQNTPPSVFSFMMKSITPLKGWVICQGAVAILWAADLCLSPYLLKLMVNIITDNGRAEAIQLIKTPALCYVGLNLFVVILFRFYDWVYLNLKPALKRIVGLTLMNRMMEHSHTLYQNQFAGNLANKVNDVMGGVKSLHFMIWDRFVPYTLAFFTALYTVAQVNPHFSIALAIWISVFVGGVIFSMGKANQLADAEAESKSTLIGHIVDILGNMMNVRLFNGKFVESRKIKTVWQKYYSAEQNRQWFFTKIHAFQGISFVIFEGTCLWYLIQGFGAGTVTAGDFALILGINVSLANNFWHLSHDCREASEFYGSITQGLRVIYSPIEIQDTLGAKPLVVTKGEIAFQDVQFHYPGSSDIFQKKSVIIKSGQKVGLVGYSGSGKTTFVNLILRLFEVSSGRILIDKQNIKDITLESLRDAIAMISQEPSLFHRSLRENISYGRMDASDEAIIEAAKRAYAHEFIDALPGGYNVLVGERGLKLSGGQRQRISIARAILKNSPILILDEATSQLDSVTENHIQDSLLDLMRDKTTLVIAHRLSTLLHMDRILVFDQGKIVEDGTHKELVAKKGMYKTLWNAQVGGFLPDKDPSDE